MNTITKNMTWHEINELDNEIYELFGSRENIIEFFGIETFDIDEFIREHAEDSVRADELAWEDYCERCEELLELREEINILLDNDEADLERRWYEKYGYEYDENTNTVMYKDEFDEVLETICLDDEESPDEIELDSIEYAEKHGIDFYVEDTFEAAFNDGFDAWMSKACNAFLKYND